MRKITWVTTLSAVALLAGCTNHDTGNTTRKSDDNATTTAVATASANDCAAIKTSDWKAWLNTMPGPGATRTLHVTGKAAPTTLGWTFELKAGPLDKMMPPTQVFDFVATKPSGMAGQTVPPPQDVSGEVPNAQPAYKSVEILCGRTTIATVPVSIVS